jgi:hypothetical protein
VAIPAASLSCPLSTICATVKALNFAKPISFVSVIPYLLAKLTPMVSAETG